MSTKELSRTRLPAGGFLSLFLLIIAFAGHPLVASGMVLELNEPAGSGQAVDSDSQLFFTVNDPDDTFQEAGFFYGDGIDNFLEYAEDLNFFNATTSLHIQARIKPEIMGSGAEKTIQRLFAHDSGGNYQMSVWRNPGWSTYNPPDGVGSIALWVSPLDKHGGTWWKPVLTDYDACPIVAGHWYLIEVSWDSGKIGSIPADIFVEDQGTDGFGTGATWTGRRNCTDGDQSQLPAERRLFAGDSITPAPAAVTVGANVNNHGNHLFTGHIDWLIWRKGADDPEGGEVAAAPGYTPGFSWGLNKDYSPGTTKNSTLGNPDDDILGNPVWSYEWIDARELPPDYAWYLQQTGLLTWDSYRYNPETWAAPGHGTVNLNNWNMNFHYSGGGYDKVPLVRWTNPTGGPVTVAVSGVFTMSWWGLDVNPDWPSEPDYWDDYLVGSPADILFMMGTQDGATGRREELFLSRYSKPGEGETTCVPPDYQDCAHVDIPVDMVVEVAAGDSIFWTARPLDTYADRNRWITVNHGSITFTSYAPPVPQDPAVLDVTKLYALVPSYAIERLVSIDPETLETETVLQLSGPIGFMANALAFSPEGELFGWDNHRGRLFQVDLETGAVFHIGDAGNQGNITGLAFDSDGNLYGVGGARDELSAIDPGTGRVTTIGPLGVDIKHAGMAVDFRTDKLYVVSGLEADYLLEVNTSSGLGTIVGSLGVDYPDVAVEFSPVTGELYAMRDAVLLMRIDMEDGRALEAGTPEDVSTTNLAAPWPVSIPVDIDIRPHARKNNMNLKSNGKIPVAIFGKADFDVTLVDPAGILFAAASADGNARIQDVDEDGLNDLVVRFRTSELDLAMGDTEACLSGKTGDGIEFSGCDFITVVPGAGKGKK